LEKRIKFHVAGGTSDAGIYRRLLAVFKK